MKNGLVKCFLLLVFSTSSINAATLNVHNGILIGAKGVIVGGAVYDVTFQDGSCISLFDGCDEASDFFFPDLDAVHEANLALLDQVFIDTPAGLFDSNPGLTNGCGSSIVCNGNTPFGEYTPGLQTIRIGFVRNRNLEHLDIHTGSGTAIRDADFFVREDLTYVLWSNPVPIPGAIWLFVSALIGILGVVQYKSKIE